MTSAPGKNAQPAEETGLWPPTAHKTAITGREMLMKMAFEALAGQDGGQVASIEKLRSILQEFDLKMPLDEGIKQLQANEPRRRALDDPKVTLTFEEFSKLFQ